MIFSNFLQDHWVNFNHANLTQSILWSSNLHKIVHCELNDVAHGPVVFFALQYAFIIFFLVHIYNPI